MIIDRTKMIVMGLLNIPPTFIPSLFSKWFLRVATGQPKKKKQRQRLGKSKCENYTTVPLERHILRLDAIC